MLTEVTSLSKRLMTGQGSLTAKIEIKEYLSEDITLVDETIASQLQKSDAERILKIYFLQIMHGQKVFLDLSTKHFSGSENILSWRPGSMWAEFDQNFIDGMRLIYRGYYFQDDHQFEAGLIQCRLINDSWPLSQKAEVINVFKNHFSNGVNSEVEFSLEQFKSSFTHIFKTLVKNKIKLDKNFFYLGIMLVTLYRTLNIIGGSYNVSKIFKASLNENNP